MGRTLDLVEIMQGARTSYSIIRGSTLLSKAGDDRLRSDEGEMSTFEEVNSFYGTERRYKSRQSFLENTGFE